MRRTTRVAPEFGEAKKKLVVLDEDGNEVNQDLIQAAANAGVHPPHYGNYLVREHLLLGILNPRPLYSHQRRELSRKGRVFLLAFVFLATFTGAMLYETLSKDLVSCSAAAYCRSNCRALYGDAGCPFTPFSAQYAGDRGYQLFLFPATQGLPSATPDPFAWCGSGELDPPVCVPACISSSGIGDDDRPRCEDLEASNPRMAGAVMCVAPDSIDKCEKTGNPNNPLETQFRFLADSMRSDETETSNTAGRAVLYVFVAVLVFTLTTIVKWTVRFVTRKGRPCCIAFVVKFLGYIIILAFVAVIVILAILFHTAQTSGSGSSFTDALVVFSTTFGGSLALDIVKLAVFFFIFPKRKLAWLEAYVNELRYLSEEWGLPFLAPFDHNMHDLYLD